MEKRLKEKGLRPTPHRVQIARRVLGEHCHFTVDEIQEWSARLKRPLSRATVYNILNEFVAVGLIRSFFSPELAKTIYDSNTENHFHLYDLDSQTVVDVDPQLISINTGALRDYKVENVEVLFKG